MIGTTSRRGFLKVAGAAVAACAARTPRPAMPPPAYKAVAFDGFALFDPTPITSLATRLFVAKGARLAETWRVKLFDYQWLRAASGRYQDFWTCTGSALAFAARAEGIELTPAARDALMQQWLDLAPWPDVVPALDKLRDARLRLAPLANLSPSMLQTMISKSRLAAYFDDLISTDRARTFKPDPRAYQLALDTFGLAREEIVFVPSAGWDAAGARWFGFPTFWVNRGGAPSEELGVLPDDAGRDLSGLVRFVGGA